MYADELPDGPLSKTVRKFVGVSATCRTVIGRSVIVPTPSIS